MVVESLPPVLVAVTV
jgi:hypothetical protein